MTGGPTSAGNVIAREANDVVEVVAPCGRIRGLRTGSVRVFRGIRYGQPPVAALRFAPPVAIEPGAGPIDAFAFGPISPQDIDPLAEAIPGTENLFYAPGTVTGEDCLSLNVWAPAVAVDAPVLVCIHGGGFLCGSGTAPWLDGSVHAAEHGLVVVTINYRLGILGGLYLGDLDPSRANLALQDQILALSWVQQNIAAFGGDPDRVTLAGQSAGAMSVAGLLFAPRAAGFFRRALIESGHLDMTLSIDDALAARRRVLTELAIDADAPATDLLACLQNVSLLRLLAAQRRLGIGGRLFPLVDDGHVLQGVSAADMPDWARTADLMVGTNLEENRLFTITGWGTEPPAPRQTMARMVNSPEDRAAATRLYASELDDPGASHRMITDRAWTEPARRIALAHSGSTGRTYHYCFAWRSDALDGRVGAAHAIDIPFFYGTLEAEGVRELLGQRIHEVATQSLGRDISAAIAQFVASGDLGASPLGEWPPFRDACRATMVIDIESEVVLDRLTRRLNFWEQHRSSFVDALSTCHGPGACEKSQGTAHPKLGTHTVSSALSTSSER